MVRPESTPTGATKPARGMAWTSAILGGAVFAIFALTWIDLTLAERDLPGGQILNGGSAIVLMLLGLPLLGMAILGVVLGVAATGLSLRQPVSYGGRRLAVAGAFMGLGALALVLPDNRVAHRMLIRQIDNANMGGLGAAFRIYADEYGRLPPDMETLINKIIQRSQLRCPDHYPEETRVCYTYMSEQSASSDPGNVLVYGQLNCASDHGAHVLFLDGRVEWVYPYSRVLELVEQTRQRLAAKVAQSGVAPPISVGTQPAP